MRIALGLGASMGDRRACLERTLLALDAHAELSLLRVSRWYRSPPMRGGTARGWFLNGVATFESRAAPRDVLALCIEHEHRAGRRRARFWGDRPLDLDVLYAEGWTSDAPDLKVPHPGICKRAFVYWPLMEVWPEAAQSLPDPPPSRHGIVPVGVFARRGPPAYTAISRRLGAPT